MVSPSVVISGLSWISAVKVQLRKLYGIWSFQKEKILTWSCVLVHSYKNCLKKGCRVVTVGNVRCCPNLCRSKQPCGHANTSAKHVRPCVDIFLHCWIIWQAQCSSKTWFLQKKVSKTWLLFGGCKRTRANNGSAPGPGGDPLLIHSQSVVSSSVTFADSTQLLYALQWVSSETLDGE